jgi:CubicO group peptidase (beta-lactamase class C family)
MASALLDDHGVRSGLELLSAWIEGQMAYRGLPGVSFAVVHDQELVWARGFGWADVERKVPATADTLYRVASISKPFTATALLQLRDAGKLRLDDPVAEVLPWFKPSPADGDASPITIRHLITHTSGLPRDAPFPYWSEGAFPSVDDIRAALPTQAGIFPTETRWKYSNLALIMAGEVVSAVSGQPWAEYVRRHILEPLGMRDSLTDTPPPDHPRLARGYARRLPSGHRGMSPHSNVHGVSAAAGLTTTVADLARFAMLQLRSDGAPVLRGRTLREMQRVHWLDPEWQMGWGLGFQILRMNNRTLLGHGGVLRGYRSELRFSVADRVAMIAMINADDGEPRLFVEKAFDWIAPALVRAATPPAAPPVADPSWQRYLGRYRNAYGDAQVLVLNGRLTWIGPNLPDPMLAPATLVPLGEHTFRIETKDGMALPGEHVVFELDANGRVARVKLGVNYVMPITEW